MPNHIPFPSIAQFRNVVKLVQQRCDYAGITDKPTLRFFGSVKLHGTNASIVYREGELVYFQSRNNVITPEADNAGFAGEASGSNWAELAVILRLYQQNGHFVDLDAQPLRPNCANAHTVAVYGEWCGGSIQKGVALAQVPKMFVVFAICFLHDGKIAKDGAQIDGQISTWLYPWEVQSVVQRHLARRARPVVYPVQYFAQWVIEVDFAAPELSQNKLAELTESVEALCPAGKYFGVEGTGEGIVWACLTSHPQIQTSDLVFKVKGEKHSDSKVKTLASVDVEAISSAKACAAMVATPHRFEKAAEAIKQLNPGQDAFDMQFLGAFLKWVASDILKEEIDTITANGLLPKNVLQAVQPISKAWFIEQSKASHAF